ncbi:hypothetical protein OHC33_005545 [Knufia fluminis]|uniref:Zn(2)-C6 fungal-type domain-containing protein n=1 Tax=Knufia fluminis TaxID=191047 RepID=A0AAN8I7P7_9EURO|nr:hypothetical protein OHC33_005545 [Knufia fluminis]
MPKERQTCTECSMRRQKCDRNLPCSRCTKRGEPEKCTREWPKNGYDPKKHRIYPRPGKGGEESPATSNDNDGGHASPSSTADRQSDAIAVHPSLRTSASSSTPRVLQDLGDHATPEARIPRQSRVDEPKETSVLEHMPCWKGNLADYQVKSFDMLKEPFKNNSRPAYPEQEYSNGFGNTNAQQTSFLQLLLPRREQIFHLVDYHCSHVLWYHACFHADSFRRELQSHYLGVSGLQLGNIDFRWSALLFSIMAGSMLTRQWYRAALTCLNLADYMWRHHLWSLQSICVLTISGHVLGFSNTQCTLHGAALKIAQGLGLQRLGPEADESILNDHDLTPAKREKIIRHEIGRRVWGQLCNQDWFSIPFSEMYTIQRSHFSTSRPQHIDDRTLLPVPAHEPSSTSFARCINEIAWILPQAHDALTSASTLYTKYEQVLHHDAKMKALEREGMPSFFSMTEPVRPEWPEWIPWARRSLALCFAHKTIMVHRSFLGKSLTDPTFEHTRTTCMAASKTILKEARQALDTGEGPKLWIDQAFMVAAGITLSLDIFHRKDTDPEYEEHRKHVEMTIKMLSKFENSMIAVRGVRLLTSLLAEQARLSAQKDMENYRKRAREDDTSTAAGDSASTPNFLQVSEGSFTSAMKRQKFDVPRFLEGFVGSDSSSLQSLRPTVRAGEGASLIYNGNDGVPASMNSNGDMVLGNGRLGNVLMQQPGTDKLPSITDITADAPNPMQNGMDTLGLPSEYGYESFEQLFPDQGGISNSFLFEDLLNFQVGDLRNHPGSNGLDIVSSGNAASKQHSTGGTSLLTPAPPTQEAGPPLPVQNHTPAQRHMRSQFSPLFMKQKQPAIPGVWGPWDPVEGHPKQPESDWPQFDPAATEHQPQADRTIAAPVSVPGSTQPPVSNETQAESSNPANTNEVHLSSQMRHPDWAAHRPGFPATSDTNLNTVPASQSLPPPQFHPIRLLTTVIEPTESTTNVESLRYTSPPPPPKHINPSTDLEKDNQINTIISKAQRKYDNGPLWGVATRPPITFDGSEDYSVELGGRRPGGGESSVEQTGGQAGSTISGQGAGGEVLEREGQDIATDAKGDKADGRRKHRGWFGLRSVYSTYDPSTVWRADSD